MSKLTILPTRYMIMSMPAIFVVLWSTGFVGAKFGLPYAEPATFLSYRFAIVAAILVSLALIFRAPWPKTPMAVLHLVISGLLVQGVYLGGVFYSLHLGVDAGVSALIAGIQPLLVAVISGPSYMGSEPTPQNAS